MPKLIDEAGARILACARRKLLESGYGALTLRAVAAECGIAVGTIYNYFKGKDELVASVMSEDWEKALARMRTGCAEEDSVSGGLRKICGALESFSAVYRPVWAQYTATGGDASMFGARRLLLRGQIAAHVSALLARLSPENSALAPLLAEAALTAASQRDIGFAPLERLVRLAFHE